MTTNFNINDNSKNTTVSYIDNNPYRFTYIRDSLTSDKKTILHIDIPDELKGESLFLAYAAYSKEQAFLNLSSGSTTHYANTFKDLIKFFSKNLYL